MTDPLVFALVGNAVSAIDIFISRDNRSVKLRCRVCGAERVAPVPTASNTFEPVKLQHDDSCAFWNSVQTSLDKGRAASGN
jgi:hypothetical protein